MDAIYDEESRTSDSGWILKWNCEVFVVKSKRDVFAENIQSASSCCTIDQDQQ